MRATRRAISKISRSRIDLGQSSSAPRFPFPFYRHEHLPPQWISVDGPHRGHGAGRHGAGPAGPDTGRGPGHGEEMPLRQDLLVARGAVQGHGPARYPVDSKSGHTGEVYADGFYEHKFFSVPRIVASAYLHLFLTVPKRVIDTRLFILLSSFVFFFYFFYYSLDNSP